MLVLETQEQLRAHKHNTPDCYFRCSVCSEVKPIPTGGGGTGYGYDVNNLPVCYECCGKQDLETMKQDGKITLYLTCEPAGKMRMPNGQRYSPASISSGSGRAASGHVSNWPGTLKFPCHTRVGQHNIARYRYDCWFKVPGDRFWWHGVTYGDNTQICHCKRTKDAHSPILQPSSTGV